MKKDVSVSFKITREAESKLEEAKERLHRSKNDIVCNLINDQLNAYVIDNRKNELLENIVELITIINCGDCDSKNELLKLLEEIQCQI